MPDPAAMPRPWLASYPPGVPPAYARPDVPVTRLLDDAARDFPDTTAAVRGRVRLTYAELSEQVDRLAAGLEALGVGPGMRVASTLGNGPAAVVVIFAVLRVGAELVHPGPLEEAGPALERTEAAVLVCDADDVPTVTRLRSGLPALHHVIVDEPAAWHGGPRRLLARLRARRAGRYRPRSSDAVESLVEVIERSEPAAVRRATAGDDVALIQYGARTGGAAVLSHRNLVAAAFQARLWVPDTQAGRERVLAHAPLTTASGLVLGLLAPVLSAATVVVARPEPEALLRTVEERGVSLLVARTAEAAAVLDHPRLGEHDLTALRVGLVIGGELDERTATAVEERTGVRLREVHGSAEAPITHANPIYGRSYRGHLGLPVTDTVAVVVDPRRPEVPLPPGESGMLAVSGPQVAGRVIGGRDGSALVGRWLLTGDRVVMHPSGSFERVGPQGEAGTQRGGAAGLRIPRREGGDR